MKKITTISFIAVLFFTSCGIFKKDNNAIVSKKIVGTWKLESMDLGQEIPAEQKALFDAMMEQMKKDFAMTFKNDGTYEIQKDAKGETEVGKYRIGDEGKTLITTTKSGKEDKITIESISSSKIAFTILDNGKTMKMVLIK